MSKKYFLTLLVAVILLISFSSMISAEQEKKLKAGFIYVGPVGDYGWSNAHDAARKQLEKKYPWLTTMFVESIPEGDCLRVINRLIREENCDVVFTTSYGYMNDTAKAAKQFTDKIFLHCAGYKRDTNLGTYFAELYQAYYINGLMAGALTKSDKIGYIAAQPIPEVIRHINAFALGIKEINPKAKVKVKWLFSWYDPGKAKEAAESLIGEGCDALAFTEDSPAVIQVGEEYTKKGKPVYTFAHYSPMQNFGETSCVSGQLVDWEPMYSDILSKIYLKTWKSEDYWWLYKEKSVLVSGDGKEVMNPKFVDTFKKIELTDSIIGKINLYDLILKRIEQMSEPTVIFEPFTGPVKDQTGAERLKSGERASHQTLWTMDWFAENIEGTIPK
ncbi:MAG: BMP family ABC transporter substrate-binding protein [Candidatus Riflebacteria bacterium]|nr:BMP family ABC transporter substrate-binding protein [Candidatus Riflebacteria bacterium]